MYLKMVGIISPGRWNYPEGRELQNGCSRQSCGMYRSDRDVGIDLLLQLEDSIGAAVR